MTPFEELKIQVAGIPSAESAVFQLVAGIAAHVAATCGQAGVAIAAALRTDAHAMAVAVVTRTKLDPAIAREEAAAAAVKVDAPKAVAPAPIMHDDTVPPTAPEAA